jgi:hypothetical protein
VPLGEALIHPVEIRGEKGGLVAAGAGADLHDGIAVVVRIAGDEEIVQLRAEGLDLGREPG